MSQTTVIVAFSVEGAGHTSAEAQAEVMSHLTNVVGPYRADKYGVTCWWIAMDDRIDGSDNDSAVFCNPGGQAQAARVLHATIARDPHTGLMHEPPAPLTGECNLVAPEVRGQFDGGPV